MVKKCKHCGLEIHQSSAYPSTYGWLHIGEYLYCHNAAWVADKFESQYSVYLDLYKRSKAEYDPVQDFNELLDKYYNEV